MAIDLKQLTRRAGTVLDGFTRGQKTMLAVAVVAALAGAAVFLRWAAAPSYAPLYGDLDGAAAAEVTSQLDAMGIPYELADNGSSVMVPRDRVHEARIDLAAEGLPSAGAPGYDLLDDQGITTSQFRQRVDYQRALQGELARTIGSIDGVDAATVHLVIPEDDLFSEDDVEPSASVLIHTTRGAELTGEQVRAVVHLVSSSVEGLQPTQVTVTDDAGRVLAAPGTDGLAAAAGDARASQTKAFEANLSRTIEQLLTPVAGPGRVRVQVAADLDFDQRATTSETFADPDSSPVVEESTTNETYTGSGGAVGGVLGPDATPVGGDGDATDYQRDESSRTYAVDKVTEQVQAAPGAVDRLSVAVLLDDGAAVDQAQVARLVTAAAGIDAERGDTLEVTAMAFDEAALPEAVVPDDGDGDPSPIAAIARIAGGIGLVLLVLFLAWRSARRSSVTRYPVPVPIEAPHPDAPTAGHELASPPMDEPTVPELAPGADERPAVSADEDERLAVQTQIGDLIDRQPEDVAQVLRGWLAEHRS